MASTFIRTMTSFSGADLIVNFGPKVIGELQQISWAIQREKAPVYTLGNADPRSFSRGKRAIAGNCIFAVFDRDALLQELTSEDTWKHIAPDAMFTAAGNITSPNEDSNFTNALSMTAWNLQAQSTGLSGTNSTSTASDNTGTVSNEVATNHAGVTVNLPQGFGLINRNNILYADTLPPLDVVLTFANEYGQAAFQKIYDMDFLNEGSGVSVDSIVVEREMSWIARRISPMMTGVYNSSEGLLTGKSVIGS